MYLDDNGHLRWERVVGMLADMRDMHPDDVWCRMTYRDAQTMLNWRLAHIDAKGVMDRTRFDGLQEHLRKKGVI